MTSPFPGVDPFIEAQNYWPDFHLKFLNYWAEAIAEGLPDEYEARLDERVSLTNYDLDEIRLIEPDIALIQRPRLRQAVSKGGTLVLEPETISTVILDEEREAYIKILHRPDRRLVTILELLSPANKMAPSRRDYVIRRNAILCQEVHLVELDLLISGQSLPMARPLSRGYFHAVIARVENREELDCDVYSWSIRQPLPLLPIPLHAPDPDIQIDLAAVYRTAIERGRYARSIDYTAPLSIPLELEDLTWAEDKGRTVRG